MVRMHVYNNYTECLHGPLKSELTPPPRTTMHGPAPSLDKCMKFMNIILIMAIMFHNSQCLDGEEKCYPELTFALINGVLNDTELERLQDELLRIFYIQYNHRQEDYQQLMEYLTDHSTYNVIRHDNDINGEQTPDSVHVLNSYACMHTERVYIAAPTHSSQPCMTNIAVHACICIRIAHSFIY